MKKYKGIVKYDNSFQFQMSNIKCKTKTAENDKNESKKIGSAQKFL